MSWIKVFIVIGKNKNYEKNKNISKAFILFKKY